MMLKIVIMDLKMMEAQRNVSLLVQQVFLTMVQAENVSQVFSNVFLIISAMAQHLVKL